MFAYHVRITGYLFFKERIMSHPKKQRDQIIDTLKFIGIAGVSIVLIVFFMKPPKMGPDAPKVGVVDGEEIFATKDSRFARYYRTLQQRYSEAETKPSQKRLEYMAFSQVAEEIIMKHTAKDYGYIVSDRGIDNRLKSEMFISNANGTNVFLKDHYIYYVRNTPRASKLNIEKGIKDGILTEMIMMDLFQSVKITSLEIFEEIVRQNTKRKIRFMFLNSAMRVANTEISTVELENFFEENITNFAQVEVSRIELTSSSAAKHRYEDLRGDLSRFADTAREISEAPSGKESGGYEGYYTKGDIDESIAKKLFAATETNILLEPIYFNGKYHLIWVRSARIPSFTNINQSLITSAYVRQNRDAIINAAKIEDRRVLEEALATGKSTSYLAENLGVNFYESDYFIFDRREGAVDAKTESPIPASDESIFMQTAFSLNKGEQSGVLEFDLGVGIIAVLDSQKPSQSSLSNVSAEDASKIQMSLLSEKMSRAKSDWMSAKLKKTKVKFGN